MPADGKLAGPLGWASIPTGTRAPFAAEFHNRLCFMSETQSHNVSQCSQIDLKLMVHLVLQRRQPWANFTNFSNDLKSGIVICRRGCTEKLVDRGDCFLGSPGPRFLPSGPWAFLRTLA